MIFYILIFSAPVIYYYNSSWQREVTKAFLGWYFLLLAVFVGVSDMLGGYDRYIYGEIFDFVADSRIKGVPFNRIITIGFSEKGYVFINYLISYITLNRYIFIFVYTLLIYGLLYYTFKKYIQNYPVALILFSAMMFFFTFTYLREIMAVCLSMLGVQYIINRKLVKFLFVAFMCYNIHRSGALFLLAYFVPLNKLNIKTVVTILTLCLIIGLTPLSSVAFEIVSTSIGIEEGAQFARGFVNKDARIEYFLEALFFSSFILLQYKHLGKTKEEIFFLNYSIVFCATLLFFIRSTDGGRISWYFIIGILYTIPSIFSKRPKDKLNNIVVVACFLLFFRILYYWGILLYPYKTFLTNGYRNGDYIHAKYEYDDGYDKDKFYRDPWLLW